MTLTLEQKEKFFRNRKKIQKVVLDEVKKDKAIIFGQRSVNEKLPNHLDVHTQDYDIFTPDNPRKLARKIERKLDKKFKGNFFVSKPAIHGGTHKVKTIIGDREVADVSKKPKKIETFKKKGIKYASLTFQQSKIKESLSDPKSKFRHAKDKETRSRIQIYNKNKSKKKSRKRKNFLSPQFEVNPFTNF